MQKLGRLGLGGLVVALAACGATRVNRVGTVGDGGGSGATGGGLGGTSGGGAVGIAVGGSGYGGSVPGGTSGNGQSGCDALPEPSCAECEQLVEAYDVRAFAATSDYVYWVEHGTLNDLNDLNDDGRVMKVTLGSHERAELVTGLPAPVALGISPQYAYVFLENHGSPLIRRYPLDRSAPEDVAAFPQSQRLIHEQPAFAASDTYAYLQIGNELHRIAEQKGSAEELLAKITEPMLGIAADETHAYFRTVGQLYSVDAPGAQPEVISQLPVWHVADPVTGMPSDSEALTWLRLSGDRFYGVEMLADHESYLGSVPKAGGSWKRLARVPDLAEAQPLNDGFFGNAYGPGQFQGHFLYASFAAPAVQSTLATFPTPAMCVFGPVAPSAVWVPTTEGVYWATLTNVYRAATR